jgi:L-threonylcarbamoyladenylate synthase
VVVEETARRLERGDVVAGPSDTVYGFLALSGHASALETLRRLKGREGPFLLLVRDALAARDAAGDVSPETWDRLRRVWPGPVTALLPGRTDDVVALRVPDAPFLAALLDRVRRPLVSTSANPPGRPEPLCAAEVAAAFPDDALFVLDGGAAASARPSTIVDLTGETPRVVRPGAGNPRPLLDPGPLPP